MGNLLSRSLEGLLTALALLFVGVIFSLVLFIVSGLCLIAALLISHILHVLVIAACAF